MITNKVGTTTLIIMLSIVIAISACSRGTPDHLYINENLGISFKYPDSWELREDTENHISLEYKEDQSVEVGIYIRIDEISSGDDKDALELLQDQIDIWLINDGPDNFTVIQVPQMKEHPSDKVATSTAVVTIPNEVRGLAGSLILPSKFYQEAMVISQDNKVAYIVILSRKVDQDPPLADEIAVIIDSFRFNE